MLKLIILLASLFILGGCSKDISEYPNSDYGSYLECLDINLERQKSAKANSSLYTAVNDYCAHEWSTEYKYSETIDRVTGTANLNKISNSEVQLSVNLKNPRVGTLLSYAWVNVSLDVSKIGAEFGECSLRSQLLSLQGNTGYFLGRASDQNIEVDLYVLYIRKLESTLEEEKYKCVKNWLQNIPSGVIPYSSEIWSWNISGWRYIDMSERNFIDSILK